MKHKNQLIRVFTGTEVKVNLLKDELETIGVNGINKHFRQAGVYSWE